MKHGGGTRSHSVQAPRRRLRFDGQVTRVLRFRATLPVGGRLDIVPDSEQAMRVQVETYVDESGAKRLRRFHLDSRMIEVADNIDQWQGADYRYVKVRGRDGDVYVLRHSEIRDEWELTMYQRSQSHGAPA
jgi:hypothetical protein